MYWINTDEGMRLANKIGQWNGNMHGTGSLDEFKSALVELCLK